MNKDEIITCYNCKYKVKYQLAIENTCYDRPYPCCPKCGYTLIFLQ